MVSLHSQSACTPVKISFRWIMTGAEQTVPWVLLPVWMLPLKCKQEYLTIFIWIAPYGTIWIAPCNHPPQPHNVSLTLKLHKYHNPMDPGDMTIMPWKILLRVRWWICLCNSMNHNLQLCILPRLGHLRSNSLILALSPAGTSHDTAETWPVDMDTSWLSDWTAGSPHLRSPHVLKFQDPEPRSATHNPPKQLIKQQLH